MLWLVDLVEKMLASVTVRLQVSNYSQLSDYAVRLQLTVRLQRCRLIRGKYSSLCTNRISVNCNRFDDFLVLISSNPRCPLWDYKQVRIWSVIWSDEVTKIQLFFIFSFLNMYIIQVTEHVRILETEPQSVLKTQFLTAKSCSLGIFPRLFWHSYSSLLFRWDEMRWDEMRWDKMRWDEMRWDEMKWDENRWNEILSVCRSH